MTVISQSRPVARRTHWCYYCAGEISPGVQYERWKNAGDGTVTTTKAHIKCCDLAAAYARAHCLEDDDGPFWGTWFDVLEWAAERDVSHPERAERGEQ